MPSQNDIIQLVVKIIAALGGSTLIAIWGIKAIVKKISGWIDAKIASQFDKDLERYKSTLENKRYVTKTIFDTEFEIYRELSKVFFDAVKTVSIMIPYGLTRVPADETARQEVEKENYLNANNAVVLAQDTLKTNMAFISKELYEAYNDLLCDCRYQLTVFSERWDRSYAGHKFGESTLEGEDYSRTKTINAKFEALNDKVRDYLAKLEVVD